MANDGMKLRILENVSKHRKYNLRSWIVYSPMHLYFFFLYKFISPLKPLSENN